MRDSAGCMEGLLCPHQVAQAGKHMQSSLLWVGAAGPLTADLQLSTGLHAALSACIPTLSARIPRPLNLPLNCGSCLPTLWLADMQPSGVSLPANVATSAEASLSALPRSQQLTLPPDLLCPAACSEHASLSASEGCRNGSPERHPPVLWAGSVIPPAHPLDAVLCSTAATLRRITAPFLRGRCTRQVLSLHSAAHVGCTTPTASLPACPSLQPAADKRSVFARIFHFCLGNWEKALVLAVIITLIVLVSVKVGPMRQPF